MTSGEVSLLYLSAAILLLTAVILLVSAGVILEARRLRRRGDRPNLSTLGGAVVAWPGSPERARSIILELADRVSPATLRELAPWWNRVAQHARSRLDAHSWVERVRSLRTLEALGGTPPEITRALADPHPRVRAAAAAVACTSTSASVADALVTALSDEDGLVRTGALEALTLMGEAATSSLVDGLGLMEPHTQDQEDPPSSPVRPAERVEQGEGSAPAHAGSPRGTHAQTRTPSFGVLEVLLPPGAGGDPGTSARTTFVHTPLPAHERTLALLLRAGAGSRPHPGHRSALLAEVLRATEHPNVEVSVRAWEGVRALSSTLTPPQRDACFAAIQRGWDHPHGAIRAAALRASGFAQARAVPAVAERLRDRDYDVRVAASALLHECGSLGGLALAEAATSPDPYAAAAARAVQDETP